MKTVTVWLVVAAAGARADEQSTVVTATRGERAQRDLTTTVTVVDREEIAQSPTPLSDELVRLEPSATTFRRSTSLTADPTSQGVNLRGLGPSATSRALVLLDGLPLNDAFGGWVYWRSAPRLGLDRIELAMGPSSALWGSAAMGGVVQLLSRPIDGFSADLEGSFGSFRSLTLAARVADRWDSLAASLEGELMRSDGYPVVAFPQRGPVDDLTPSWHGVLNGRVEWYPLDSLKLTVRASMFREEQNGGTRFTDSAVQMRQLSMSAAWFPLDFGRLDVAVQARDSRFDQRRARINADRSVEALSAAQAVPVSEQSVSAVWSAPPARLLGLQRFSAGLDLRRVRGFSDESLVLAGARREAGGEQQLAGVFVQDLWSIVHWLQLSAAVRADVWRNLDGVRIDTPNGATANVARYPDRAEVSVNPHFGLRLQPLSWLALKASGGRGFRAPTLNEMYRPFQVGTVLTAANANLSAESVWSAEAGAEVSGPWGLRLRATGFFSDWRDPIVNATLDQPLPGGETRQRQNLGSAQVRGLELALGFRPVRQLRFHVAYTLTDSRVVSAPGLQNLVGKRLPQDPVHRGVAAITFDDPRFLTATVQVRVIGPQFEDDANTLEMAGVLLVDCSLSRRLIGPLELFVAVENLLDRQYLVGRAGVDTLGEPFTLRAGLAARW